MDISGIVSLFSDLAFPVAVAVYFMVFTSRQLERIRTDQIKLEILIGLALDAFDICVPDAEIEAAVKQIRNKRKGK